MSAFQDNRSINQRRRLDSDTTLARGQRSRRANFSSRDVYASESASTPPILSSTSYPIPQPLQLGRPTGLDADSNNHVLFGGLSIYNMEIEDPSNAGDGTGDIQENERKRNLQTRSARRRPKKDKSLDNDQSRKRGRPRILTKDETSTERRRTQIRLAQRAYRLRKESTISALNDRVAELETTIEEMSKSFLSFNDELMASRLLPSQPDLVHSLRNITETFLALARVSRKENDHELDFTRESEHMEMSSLPENSRGIEVQDSILPPCSALGERDEDDSNTSSADTFNAATDEFFTRYPHPDFEQTTQVLTVSDAEQAVFVPESLGEGSSRFSLVGSPLPSLLPSSHDLQEPSFTHRLRYRCLERGYELLSDPTSDPRNLLRVFRLTLGISSRKLIMSRFKRSLNQPYDNGLEAWNVPFFHLGGAGTHYPRRDVYGNPVYPPNMHSISEAFGFWTFQVSEAAQGESSSGDLLRVFGVDGEWFDSHDVEGFLREKGIFLDDHSSFLEVPESVLTVGPPPSDPVYLECNGGKTTGRVAGESTCFNEPGRILDSEQQIISDITNAADREPHATQLSYEGLSTGLDTGTTLADRPNVSNGSTFPHMYVSKQSSLTIDVGQFVERLVSRAICLGRAPGFRKRDVEDSLQYAIRCI